MKNNNKGGISFIKILPIIIVLVVLLVVGLVFVFSKTDKKEDKVEVPNILLNTSVKEIPIEEVSWKLRNYLDNYQDVGYFYEEVPFARNEEEVTKIKEAYKEHFTDEEGKLDEESYEAALVGIEEDVKGILIIKDREYYKYNDLIMGEVSPLTDKEFELVKKDNFKPRDYTKPIELTKDNIDLYSLKDEEGNPIKDDKGNPKIDNNKLYGWTEGGDLNLTFVQVENTKVTNGNLYKYSAFEITGEEILENLKNNMVNITYRDNEEVKQLEKFSVHTELDEDTKIYKGELRRLTNDNNVKTAIFQNEETRKTFFVNDLMFNTLKDYKIRTNFKLLYNRDNEILDLRMTSLPSDLKGVAAEVIGIDPDKHRIRIKEGGKEYLLLYGDMVEEVKDLSLQVNDLVEVVYKKVEEDKLTEDQIEVVVGDTTERKVLVNIDRYSIKKDSAKKEDYKVLDKEDLNKKDEQVLEKLLSTKGYYVSTDNSNVVLISTDKDKAIRIEEIYVKQGKLNIKIKEEQSDIGKNYIILDVTSFGLEDLNDKKNISIKDQDNKELKQMIVKKLD